MAAPPLLLECVALEQRMTLNGSQVLRRIYVAMLKCMHWMSYVCIPSHCIHTFLFP